MFDEITLDSLSKQKMALIDPKYDKREGSLISIATSANTIETRMFYIDLDYIVKNMFPQTADRGYLIQHADVFGIEPYPASQTIVKARFNIPIPVASRFNAPNGDANFFLFEDIGLEADGFYYYLLKCEQYGSLSINPIGRITPIKEIQGLTLAEIVSVEIPGEDEEETEHFRQRFEKEKRWGRYGGNIADYQAMTHTIAGVGAVKVVPTPNGVGGEVGLYILDAEYNVPKQTLLDTVKEEIDPIGFEGQGMGLAPIDHKVYVWPAKSVPINISFNLTYAENISWVNVKSKVKEIIDEYLAKIRANWEFIDTQTVYILQIEMAIMSGLAGMIVDITDTLINGSDQNIVIGKYEVPVVGEVVAV